MSGTRPGRKLKVLHHARRGARYICCTRVGYSSDQTCIVFSNGRIDAAVSGEVLRAISPLAIDAALQVMADREQATAERRRQSELTLEQARYEANLARRQCDAVDPDNRLVAGELERRWNERLAAVARLEEQIRSLREEPPSAFDEDERARLLALADDLPQLWNHPAASTESRKRILRAILKEIVVTVADARLHLVLHWQGGDLGAQMGWARTGHQACLAHLFRDAQIEPANRQGQKLLRIIKKYRQNLFVFITNRAVPSTNNGSEQALRPCVIFRKITNCFRSQWGAKLYADVRSVFETARRRGIPILQAIRLTLDERPLPSGP